jgi:hypothetical protein
VVLVQVTSLATLTQLTRLEIQGLRLRMSDPPAQEMETLSSLRNLRAFTSHNWWNAGGWFHACVAAWRQLQELRLSNLDIPAGFLQALAALPSLHTLQCNLPFGGAGHVQLASLQHLTLCRFSLPSGTPSELAAFSAPQLRTVEGLDTGVIQWSDEAQDQQQMIADTARAAGGILQWATRLCVWGSITGGVLDKLLSALHNWQPLQRAKWNGLTLGALDIKGPASLAHLPPAVRCLM